MSWFIRCSNIEDVIKNQLSKSVAVQKLFARFNFPISLLEKLRIVIDPIKDQDIYAETNIDSCRIRESLFDQGIEAFIKNHMYIIAHEIVHFVFRQAEQRDIEKQLNPKNFDYFDDPEEIIGMIMSIAYEIEQGSSKQEIVEKVYPKIEFHFKDKQVSERFFKDICDKAQDFL